MNHIYGLVSSEAQRILNIIEKGEKNIFIEVEDNYLKGLIIDEIINSNKLRKAIFIREEARDYETFINDLQKRLEESFRKLTRGASFSLSNNKSDSRKVEVIKLIEYISKYANLILIIEKLEEAKKSLIDLIEGMTSLSTETKVVTVIFANSKNYNTENLQEISRIKNSKNFEYYKVRNLNFEEYEDILQKEYFLPLDILLELYERSEGSLEYTYSELSILRSKRYIDDIGRWSGGNKIPDEIPRGFNEMISYRYKILDDNKKDLLRWLSMLEEGIEAETLKKISGLNENQFINALEGLNESGIVKINGNNVIFEDKKMMNFIRSSISEYSKTSMAKIILNNIDEESPSFVEILMEAKEFDKAEEVIIKYTDRISSRNINRNQSLIESLLRYRRSERLLRRYARLLLYQGYKKEANEVLKEIEEKYKEPSSGFYALKAWAMGIDELSHIDDLLEKAKDPTDKNWIIFYKVYNLWQKGEIEEAVKVGQELINSCDSIQIRGEALRIMGNIALDNEEYEKAIDYYEKARIISENIGDFRNLSRILSNESNVYFAKGEEEKAFEYMRKSKAIAKENFDIPVYVIIDYNQAIAEYDYQLISYDQLVKKLERMENIVMKYGSPTLIQNYLLTLASIHLFSLEFKGFNEYINKAEREINKRGNKFQAGRMEILKALQETILGKKTNIRIEDINQLNSLDYVVIKILQNEIDEAYKFTARLPDENEGIFFKSLIRIMRGENTDNIKMEMEKFLQRRSIFSDFLRDLFNIRANGIIDYEKYIRSGNALTLIAVGKILKEGEREIIIDMLKKKKNVDVSHLLR